jgi:hypothetical protein
MLDPERAVIPQRLKRAVIPQRLRLEARELRADEVEHLDRLLGHHCLRLRDEHAAIILVRYRSDGFDYQRVRRQTLDRFEYPPAAYEVRSVLSH